MTTDYAVVGANNKVKDRCPQMKVGLFFFGSRRYVRIYPYIHMSVESRKSDHRRRWDYFQ